MKPICIEPLTQEAFAPFGDVIALRDQPTAMINEGRCARHHALAHVDCDGIAGISLFEGEGYSLPLILHMMERHPLGSQAFIPMQEAPFLVIVASDKDGIPDQPRAFLSNGRQGVSYPPGQWHGVLTPLSPGALFAVVDLCAERDNLEEHWFDVPWLISG